MHRAVLADRKRILGDQRHETLDTRHNLASVIASQGRLAEAKQMLTRRPAATSPSRGSSPRTARSVRLGWEIPLRIVDIPMIGYLLANSRGGHAFTTRHPGATRRLPVLS